MNSREFIVLHHSDDPTQGPQFDKINAYHKAKGFPKSSLGYYVGYHYFIGFDGTIKVARAEWETGAHCNAQLMNYRGIGICLAGALHKRPPNDAQIKSLVTLVKDIQSRNMIPDTKLRNHRDCKPTTCPGMDLVKVVLERKKDATPEDLHFQLEHYKQVYATATDPNKKKLAARIIRRLSQFVYGNE